MFVRFVVGTDAENFAWLNGIFTEAKFLSRREELFKYELDQLNSTFDWFNDHLPCPPFLSKLETGEWTREAVAWYRAEATHHIRRMWDIAAILRENGINVRLVTSEKPGKLVYEDEFQIVAETPQWS